MKKIPKSTDGSFGFKSRAAGLKEKDLWGQSYKAPMIVIFVPIY